MLVEFWMIVWLMIVGLILETRERYAPEGPML